MSADDTAAKDAYGVAASRHAILSGGIEPPPALEPFYARLSQMAEGAITEAPSRGNASLERMTAGERVGMAFLLRPEPASASGSGA